MSAPRRRLAAALALGLVAGLGVASAEVAQADQIELDVEIPSVATEPFTVSNAQLRWGLNVETGGGAFAGGCNFLSAGEAGDTGSSRVWTEQDGFFRTTSGAVTIEKPVGTAGRYGAVKFADRCRDANGDPVSTSNLRGTGIQAVINGGKGEVDPVSGDATISWNGSFTVAFYGGMTYWWVTDPVLTIKDGAGTLRAEVGGYGASMDNPGQWDELDPETVVLATLAAVSLQGDRGFTTLPAYRGVEVSLPKDATEQVKKDTEKAPWGAFPQSFIDFQARTGQLSYWYSSGGARDGAKPASTLSVSYDADEPQDPDEPVPGDGDDDGEQDEDETPKNPVKPPPTTKPAPPKVNVPPGGTTLAIGSAGAAQGLPGAVMAPTVLPALAEPAAANASVLASTGSTPAAPVLASAAILLGIALTLLGYRLEWLVWPGSGGAGRKGTS